MLQIYARRADRFCLREISNPAIEQAIADCKQRIADVLKLQEPYTWDNLVAPLEEVDDRLSRIWSPVSRRI